MAQDPSKIQPEKISIYKEKEIEDYRTEQKEMNSEGQKKSQEQEDIATCDKQSSDFGTLTGPRYQQLYFCIQTLKRISEMSLKFIHSSCKLTYYQLGRVNDYKGK